MSTPPPRQTAVQASATPSFRQRLFWLAACFAAGLTVGVLGHRWTGDDAWFLALPGCIVLGWLYFGRPDRCARCQDAANHDQSRWS